MAKTRRWLMVVATTLSILLFMITGLLMIFMGPSDGGVIFPTDSRRFIISLDEYKIELGYNYMLTVIESSAPDSAEPAEIEEPISSLDGHPSLPLPRNGAYPAIRYLHRPPRDYHPTRQNVHSFLVGPQITLPYWFILLLASLLPAWEMRRLIF
jgi:hypothetical protein